MRSGFDVQTREKHAADNKTYIVRRWPKWRVFINDKLHGEYGTRKLAREAVRDLKDKAKKPQC